MPELPDIELYCERLRERLVGRHLAALVVYNPFVLRSLSPTPAEIAGAEVSGVERLGKRIVFALDGDRFVVLHLMIAGRLQWQSPAPPEKRAMGKVQLASFRFESGQLTLVESSTKKRASIHLVASRSELAAHTRQGMELFQATPEAFAARLRTTNRTLKRALTDPNAFDGIGNAYSDEILFAARLSPVLTTKAISDDDAERLRVAATKTLAHWRDRLRDVIPGFPKPSEITAFRPDFAVHGRYGLPCPVCGSPIQRIVYAENETNYCARCQNEGRLLADRSLSRLLRSDWPKTLEELDGV